MKKSRLTKLLNTISESVVVQIPFTLLIYAFYVIVVALALMPSVAFAYWALSTCWPSLMGRQVLFIPFVALTLPISAYVYFLSAPIILGLIGKVLALGIKAGKHPAVSFTMLRWLLLSGVYLIAQQTALPFVRMSWFINMFFRLLGCKMGKNVRLNTDFLNDPYLMELGDNVIVGGKAEISCHTFEGDKLVLGPIKIGKNTAIGASAYINPNVSIGANCQIGNRVVVRKNTTLPDRSIVVQFPALEIKQMARLNKRLGLKKSRHGR